MKPLFLFLFLLLPACLFSQTTTDSIRGLLSSYQYREALDLTMNEIHQNPEDKSLYRWRGFALKGLLRFPEAVNAFETALNSDTADFLLLTEIANCYKAIGNYGKTLQNLEKARLLKPDNFYVKSEIAGTYFLNEDYLQARDRYLSLYRPDTTNVYLLRVLARCYENLHKSDSAAIFYQKIISIIPRDVQSVISLANLYIELGRYPQVIQLTEYYRLFDTKNQKINRLHAYGYYLTEKYRTSLQLFTTCLSQQDTSIFVYRYLGFSYFHFENYDSAKIYLEKAFFKDTLNSNICYPLGISCTMGNHKELGVYYLTKALELVNPAPELHSEILQHLSIAYNNMGQYLPALSALLKAQQITPGDTLLKFRIALQYHDNLNNSKMAIRYYREFLKTRPVKKENKNTASPLVVSYYSVAEQRLKELETQK